MADSNLDRIEVHAGVLAGIAAYARQIDLNMEPLLRSVGLTADAASKTDGFINLEDFGRLLDLGASASGDEAFGLNLAAATDFRVFGALDYAVTNARNLRESLMVLVRYIPSRVDLARFELVIDGERVNLEWSLSPLIVQRSQLADYFAMALVSRIGHIIRPSWRTMTVALERPQPARPATYRKLLGRGVCFGQSMNAISLASSNLDLPVINADPHLQRMAIKLCEQELAERLAPRDFRAQVREQIASMLHVEGGKHLQLVARRLGLSARSLQRRLQQEGTSFQQELDETRKDLAKRYISETDIRFSQISFRLGFSAPSAFNRAVFRWFAERPSTVRRKSLIELHNQ